MTKNITYLSVAIVALTLAGCGMYGQNSNLPPGQYEQHSSTVDSKGTARTTNKSTDVYYDEYGNKKVNIDKKTTTDPKGLMNKTTTKSHQNME